MLPPFSGSKKSRKNGRSNAVPTERKLFRNVDSYQMVDAAVCSRRHEFAFVRTAAVSAFVRVFLRCYILDYTIIYRIPYSVVIVVTEQRAGQPRIRCPIAERWKRFFLFSKRPDWLWGPTQTPIQKLNGLLPRE